MTERPFVAFAPITPPASSAQDPARHRVARVAWLVARFARREPVRYEEYRQRFGRPQRSFCCEVAALREAGIIRGSELLERHHRSDAR
jgi:hypothetical protein